MVRYILRYIISDKNEYVPRKNFVITHNMRSRSIEGYIREMDALERSRIHTRSKQVSIHHAILSWGTKDSVHVTDIMLKDMARKFIMLRAPRCKAVATVHKDRSHVHLHFAISATQLNSKANRVSKARFAEIKREMEEYQQSKYPQLIHSSPGHGLKRISKELPIPALSARTTKKNAIVESIMSAFERAKSIDEFIKCLQANGCQSYSRGKNIVSGVIVDGTKYRLVTLGFDPKDIEQSFTKLAQKQQARYDIQMIREKSVMKDRGFERKMVREIGREG